MGARSGRCSVRPVAKALTGAAGRLRALLDRSRHRLALVDYVDGEQLERFVTGDGEGTVRHVAYINLGYTRFEGNLFPVRQCGCSSVDDVVRLFAGMCVYHTGCSGWDF